MTYFYEKMKSPVGELTLVGNDDGLAAILWENDDPKRLKLGDKKAIKHPILLQAKTELSEYFVGKRKKFSVKLNFVGTDFQKKVWAALLTIPFGETRSYQQIAIQVGNKKACRAVGAANGKNPIAIIAPCHRVIGTSGKLTGFAGGLEIKSYLLGIEKIK